MSLQAATTAIVGRYGSTWTLRTITPGGAPNAWTQGSGLATYTTFKAKGRRYKPTEIRGGILEHDELVTVDAASMLVTPKEGDRIAPGEFTSDAGAAWRQIVNVYPATVGGKVVSFKLQVRR